MTAKRTDKELSALAKPLSMFHDLGPVDAKFCKHTEFRTALVWNSKDSTGLPDKSKGLTLYITDYLDEAGDDVLTSFLDTVLTRLEGGNREPAPVEPFVEDALKGLWKTHRERYLRRLPAMLNASAVHDHDRGLDTCIVRLDTLHALDIYTQDERKSVVLKTYSRSPESSRVVFSKVLRTACLPCGEFSRMPIYKRAMLVLALYDHMLRDDINTDRICAVAAMLSTPDVTTQQILRELTDIPESYDILGGEAWMIIRAVATCADPDDRC